VKNPPFPEVEDDTPLSTGESVIYLFNFLINKGGDNYMEGEEGGRECFDLIKIKSNGGGERKEIQIAFFLLASAIKGGERGTLVTRCRKGKEKKAKPQRREGKGTGGLYH